MMVSAPRLRASITRWTSDALLTSSIVPRRMTTTALDDGAVVVSARAPPAANTRHTNTVVANLMPISYVIFDAIGRDRIYNRGGFFEALHRNRRRRRAVH